MADSAHAVRIKAHWEKGFDCLSVPAESDLVAKTSEGKEATKHPEQDS